MKTPHVEPTPGMSLEQSIGELTIETPVPTETKDSATDPCDSADEVCQILLDLEHLIKRCRAEFYNGYAEDMCVFPPRQDDAKRKLLLSQECDSILLRLRH